MSSAAKRAILRWIHLVLVIPILGFVYQSPSEVQQYAAGVRFIFLPGLMFSGYWMYAGATFAIIGVGLWLGVYRFSGFGPALLSQFAFFVAWKVGSVVRARRSKSRPA